MGFAAISPVWAITAAALLVFLLLVVLRFALGMVGEVKKLAATIRETSEQLQDALAEVRAESDLAAERAERLRESRSPGSKGGDAAYQHRR